MSSPKIPIELTNDEALVLFDWLKRWEETEQFTIEDESEFRVLCYITCILERELVEPFMPNYGELLEKARSSVRYTEED